MDRRAVPFVGRQALEGHERPRDVVGALVRQEVPDEPAAAPRDDATPVLSVPPEHLALERIDLVANDAGNGHGQTMNLA